MGKRFNIDNISIKKFSIKSNRKLCGMFYTHNIINLRWLSHKIVNDGEIPNSCLNSTHENI